MSNFSNNPMWEAFRLRGLASASYGGADTAECVSTIAQVGNGTSEDWYRQWTWTAERVFSVAVTSQEDGHLACAREAYFRASNYYHLSYLPLFGAPVDPWLVDAFARETDAFLCAARLNEFPIEPVEIPFEDASLPGYFLRPSASSQPRPTILQVNGYDSNIQEMYFMSGLPAVRRGYNVLLLDGPGQGRNLIRDEMEMRPDWEIVVSAAVDYLLTRGEVDRTRIALAGRGFGGYLVSRAAAFEKRITALIADPGLWDQRQNLSDFYLPPEVILRFPDISREVFDAIEEQLRSPDTDALTRWKILQRGMWVHGVDNLYDLIIEMCRYEISGLASKISCPTLITAYEGDPLANQAEALYAALTCPKHLIRVITARGVGGSSEFPAHTPCDQRVFDWLDTTLGVVACDTETSALTPTSADTARHLPRMS